MVGGIMDLTQKQIDDLNNMNVAAQNVQLGDIVQQIINSSSGSISWINIDELVK